MARQSLIGCAYLLVGFAAWGFNPIYFKVVLEIPPLELLAHRVLWALPMLALFIALAKSWPTVKEAFQSRRVLATLLLTAVLLAFNWLIYIWAVFDEKILEASLGYYITPLCSLVLGFAVLRERLSRLQGFAVLLATAGVLNLLISQGVVPWLGLALAATFSIYAWLRKTAAVPSVEGLFIETLFMLPLALLYCAWLAAAGLSTFGNAGLSMDLLMIAAGPVTALPLLWFTSGARRLRLSTVAMFQFIAPTCQFGLAVFYYDEPFGTARLVTFALVWLGVAIFTFESVQRSLKAEATA